MTRHRPRRAPRPGSRRGFLAAIALIGALALVGFGLEASQRPEADAGRTTFVVLRHAEKADDGTRNPPLTDAGNERAERTAALLASLDVAAVVSTPYTRTEQTAKPIAELFSLDVETYDPRKAGDALDRLGREHAGRVVVVVGHSNTVPAIVRALGADPGVEQIDEAEYGRVYLVTPVEGAEPVCHLLRS